MTSVSLPGKTKRKVMNTKFVIQIKQAAQMLGLPINTIRKLIKRGVLDGRGFGPAGRIRYVTSASVDKLMVTTK